MNESLLSRRQLIEKRNWTADLFQFLPPPDETRPNPHNIRGPAVRLYRIGTIIDLEQRAWFQTAMEAAAKRRIRAGKAIETKRRKLRETVAALPAPELPALSRAELSRRALEAAAVEYLLTELAPYGQTLLSKCKGAEVAERQRAINEKILNEIASRQPWLAFECQRRKNMVQRAP